MIDVKNTGRGIGEFTIIHILLWFLFITLLILLS